MPKSFSRGFSTLASAAPVASARSTSFVEVKAVVSVLAEAAGTSNWWLVLALVGPDDGVSGELARLARDGVDDIDSANVIDVGSMNGVEDQDELFSSPKTLEEVFGREGIVI